MAIRPIDIARVLGVSTSSLRKYGEWGLCPPVPRGENGYRQYSLQHVAYLVCARRMMPAFYSHEVAEIFTHLYRNNQDEALWLASAAAGTLHSERATAAAIVKKLLGRTAMDSGAPLTVQGMSRQTGVPATTLRYWDSIGLVRPESRGEQNGYRLYSLAQVRQVLAVYALKLHIHSKRQPYSIAALQEALSRFDMHDTTQLACIMQDTDAYLRTRNAALVAALAALHELCAQLKKGEYINYLAMGQGGEGEQSLCGFYTYFYS